MTQSRLTAVALTLFMGILVLAAAFVFTFQAQTTLKQRVSELEMDVDHWQQEGTRTAVTLNTVEATRAATTALLNAVETDAVALEGQLVARQREIEQMQQELSIAQATLLTATTNLVQYEQQLLAPPLVTAVLQKSAVISGEPIRLWVAAGDPTGLERVDITIAGSTDSYLTLGSRLFTQQITPTISATGLYTITVTAVKTSPPLSSSTTLTVSILSPPTVSPLLDGDR